MTLIETVRVSRSQTMAIYELSDAMKQKYGKKYLLATCPYAERALARHDEEYFINNIREYYYEGLFETRLEAYLTTRIVEANVQLSYIANRLNELKDISVHEIEIQGEEQ